jgi:rhamnogalacturonan acetylesterase
MRKNRATRGESQILPAKGAEGAEMLLVPLESFRHRGRMNHRAFLVFVALFVSVLVATVGLAEPVPGPGEPPRPKATLWIIGDSTVKNNQAGFKGWGDFIAPLLPPQVVEVKNHAIGGRSSRSFMTEGRWDEVQKQLQPGDIVLMQFGHNDNGPLDKGKARASIKGNGDQSQVVTMEATQQQETVHSYGWYLRHYIAGAKAKGALPVVLSLVPRNMWKEGKFNRATTDFTAWAQAAAAQGGANFLDLNARIADVYDQEGAEKVGKDYFTTADHTHTTPAGAQLNARCVVDGLKALPSGAALTASTAAKK